MGRWPRRLLLVNRRRGRLVNGRRLRSLVNRLRRSLVNRGRRGLVDRRGRLALIRRRGRGRRGRRCGRRLLHQIQKARLGLHRRGLRRRGRWCGGSRWRVSRGSRRRRSRCRSLFRLAAIRTFGVGGGYFPPAARANPGKHDRLFYSTAVGRGFVSGWRTACAPLSDSHERIEPAGRFPVPAERMKLPGAAHGA